MVQPILEDLEARMLLASGPTLIHVIDDGAAGFTTTGTWTVKSGGHDGDHRTATAAAGNKAVWTFSGLQPGYQYRISVSYISADTNSASANYRVVDVLQDGSKRELGVETINLTLPADDFNFSGTAWEDIGTFMIRGTTLSVELTGAGGGMLVADAIRIERVGSWVPPTGTPAPSFGIEQTHWMYSGKLFDYGNGLEPYRDAGNGPYTHYIDNKHPNATNTNNPFGTPDRPRLTVPANLPAGSVVEIHGGPYPSAATVNWFSGSGTADKPIFIRGADPANRVVFTYQSLRIAGQYMVIENIKFDYVWLNLYFASGDAAGKNHHIAFRNNEITGLPPAFATAFPVNRGHDVVIYNNYIHNNGDPNYHQENDLHGVSALAGAKNVWYVDNYSHGNGGDSIQINSGNVGVENYARYIYIGRNIMHGDGENAVDIKQARDVIISDNIAYGYRPTSFPTSGSDGTAIVVHYNPIDVWIINNEIFNSTNGIRSNGSARGWIIGNVIHDIRATDRNFDPASFWAGSGGAAIITWAQPELWVVGNTIYNADFGFTSPSGGTQSHNLVNNIFAHLTPGSYAIAIPQSSITSRSVMHNNLFYQDSGAVRIRWAGGTYSDIPSLIAGTGKGHGSLIANPLFVNRAARDARLADGSPAVDAGANFMMPFNTFQSLYGISIAYDLLGVARPYGIAFDMGAYEKGAAAPIVPPPPGPGDDSEILGIIGVNASSYQEGNGPENAIDGNLATRWSAEGKGQWITFDLGQVTDISQVLVAWHAGDRRVATFDIMTSTDGLNWTLAFSGKSNGWTTNFESYTLDNAAGRYVRIVGYGTTEGDWNSISEVQLRGKAGTGDPGDPSLPQVSNDTATTTKNTPVLIDVLANDTGNSLAIESFTQPTNGTVTLQDGKLLYTPVDAFVGTDSFTYTVVDADGQNAQATVTVTVISTDPIANNDSATTVSGSPVLIDVLANDSHPTGSTLAIESFTQPTNGTVTLQDGKLLYTPATSFIGTDSFTYTIVDADGQTAQATVTVTVTERTPEVMAVVGVSASSFETGNEPANAIDGRLDTRWSAEGKGEWIAFDLGEMKSIAQINIAWHAGWRRVAAFEVQVSSNGTSWTTVYTGKSTGTTAELESYTLDGAAGRYVRIVGYGNSENDWNSISEVRLIGLPFDGEPPVNQAPVAQDDSAETAKGKPVVIDVLINDTDPDGDTLVIDSFTQPANGTATLVDGKLVYAPADGFVGTDSFTYTVSDGHGGTATATVTVTVLNSAPIAEDIEAESTKGVYKSITIDVLAKASDPDGDTLVIDSFTQPANGKVKLQDGKLIYTANTGFYGQDSFTYTVSDGFGGTATATVTITVHNTHPVAIDDSAQTEIGTPVVIDVLANDTDNGYTLIIDSFTQPANGQVTLVDGRLLYTPADGFVGTDSFTYVVSDSFGGSAQATVMVTVVDTATPPPPVQEPTKLAVKAVTASSFEPGNGPQNTLDGSLLTRWSAEGKGQWISYDLGEVKSLSQIGIAWHAGWRRVATFEVQVSTDGTTWTTVYSGKSSGTTAELQNYDLGGAVGRYVRIVGYGNSENDWNSITVVELMGADAPNRAPVAKDDAAETVMNRPVVINVLGNDSDPDGDTLVVASFTQPANGTVTIDSSGRLIYTPKSNWIGPDQFTYTVSDGRGGTSTATVKVVVAEILTGPWQSLSIAGVTASSHEDGNGPANAIDGNLQTRWSALGKGQWIAFDLGKSREVGEVRIAWHAGWRRTALFDIQVSSNGSTWTTVYSGSSSGTTGELETYKLATPVTARYVRIVGFGNSENDWNSITNVNIIGC